MDDFFLPPHVHFCFRGDAAVFLDVKQDDYTLMAAPLSAALRALAANEGRAASCDSGEALKDLLDGGLLTRDRSAGRTVAPTRIAPAGKLLLPTETMPTARMSARHAWRFLVASIRADAELRWCRLERTITRVQRRKARQSSTQRFDLERARDLVAIFARLRSFFPRNYLCLYDSLALVEFLARHGIFPNWVFGVQLEPWGAHCWVQEAELLFNEEVEVAAGYTPVMAI